MYTWSEQREFHRDSHFIPKPIAITIGNFDGLHAGHRALIQETVQFAQNHKGSALAVTFNPHPQAFLNPEKGHSRIFSFKDQQVQLEGLGIQGLFCQSFSREFSQLSPQDFVENFIVKYFHPAFVCVGEDFRFGAFRAGSGALLQELGHKHHFEVRLVPAIVIGGEVVSTTKIKNYLSNGNVKKVREFLGRNYSFQGLVEAGEGRGRQLGIPTANVNPDVEFSPRQGVYVCQVYIKGESSPHRAVVNIGINKTFVTGEAPLKFEVHILDWNRDLYGQHLKVELLDFLRPEKKFSGKEELKSQIDLDVKSAREYRYE